MPEPKPRPKIKPPTILAEVTAGVDEAGRGCLAGPVYAAAVILPVDHGIVGLRDSKKLSPSQRESLQAEIRARALAWAIGMADVVEIDSINILRASLLAMSRAVTALKRRPELCLVDGNQVPPMDCRVQTVIGGDDCVESIMAASILAKTARDAELVRLDALHPGYGLARHKGYGTPDHLRALSALGPCAVHRMSFGPCKQGSFRFPGPGFPIKMGDASGISGNRDQEAGN